MKINKRSPSPKHHRPKRPTSQLLLWLMH
ncbi:hypothetical protein Goklo_027404 [Gossypium klotzschianum]|uniref:Uncharacterized protein n=1 Tax=Gossypium klotzschianum TaxID=34286 RepID=A0A7J8TY50_9ROSI|nr:hypothetical protein [Gossypium klotzschianum]